MVDRDGQRHGGAHLVLRRGLTILALLALAGLVSSLSAQSTQAPVNVPPHVIVDGCTGCGGSVPAATATLTNVANAATSTQLLALNTSRLGAVFVNDSTTNCYVNYGASASSAAYTVKLGAGYTWNMQTIYTGVINAACDSATGTMRVTELQ